jgi:hypothetical protein
MKTQVSNKITDKLIEFKHFAYVRGRATSYNYYSATKQLPEPTAFSSDCFNDFLKEPFVIPVLLDHRPDEIIGVINEIHNYDYQLSFEAKIFDITVFSLKPNKFNFSIGTKYNRDDTKETDDGLLIKNASITEISIVTNPADKTAIEF